MRRHTLVAAAVLAIVVLGAVASSGAGSNDKRPAEPRPAARTSKLTKAIADGRLATAKYVTDLERAKADGYRIITPMIRDMGFHYMNPEITDFDVRRPPILVYLKRGDEYQLGALEWVFPKKPAKPPLPGAKYGSFAAACHYEDGTFVPEKSEQACPTTSPETGAAFGFWHPKLVTLHFWVWYPNPDGLFAGMNPFVKPFNRG